MGDDYGVMILGERLEIKRLAKKKAIKWTIIIGIITFIVLAVTMVMLYGRKMSLIEWIILIINVIAIISVLFMTLGQKAIQLEEISKRSKEYVETYLSKEDDVEVIPIDGKSYKEFMQRKGKFYARIISDNEVGIWFQYNDEKEKEFLEKVYKSDFENYWLVETMEN